ncbi:hypothetical protein ABII15_31615 [Streptomyces sp. HUAS MG91]|uniref:Acyl-CoA carboxylase subunit epsilon n=1 Tax=Streptomyces tabacisoli TaxID=3156398 RepID=A0AAU8J2T9_9ACTN
MTAEEDTGADASRTQAATSWRIVSGAPTAEEVAAVAVALSTVLTSTRAVRATRGTGAGSRGRAPWPLSSTRRRTVTSWASGPLPGWRGAA